MSKDFSTDKIEQAFKSIKKFKENNTDPLEKLKESIVEAAINYIDNEWADHSSAHNNLLDAVENYKDELNKP